MTEQQHISAAQGYLDLGMGQRAWDELDLIDPKDRAEPEVLEMRFVILRRMEKWQMGAKIARGAVRRYPEHGAFYLLGAYHLRRVDSLNAAYDFLQSGEEHLKNDARYWFAMACYHCQLGRLDETRECVKKATQLDRNYQWNVLEDEDLRPLWDSWGNGKN